MSATIISGKELSSLIRERITKETEELTAKYGKKPGLAVIQVGENPASTIYVNNKKKACEQVGFQSFGYSLPESATEQELLDLIDQLKGKPLGDALLISSAMLRFENDLFLDDVSVDDVMEKLHTEVLPIHNDGKMLIDAILGKEEEDV